MSCYNNKITKAMRVFNCQVTAVKIPGESFKSEKIGLRYSQIKVKQMIANGKSKCVVSCVVARASGQN